MATLAPLFFSGSSLFLQVTSTTIYNISDGFEFQLDPTSDCGVSCPLVFEKSLFCVVATLAPSILIGSSSYLEVTRIAEFQPDPTLDRKYPQSMFCSKNKKNRYTPAYPRFTM